MKMQNAVLVAALWIGGAAYSAQTAAPPVPQMVVAKVDASQSAQPVSKYVFGMFIEHIGKTMYGPLWAEMLDDRKFYFPIMSTDPETKGRQGGLPAHAVLRKWRPVGPGRRRGNGQRPPVRRRSKPADHARCSIPHGIRQSGLALVRGKQYTGRIWVRGTPAAK